MCYLEQDRLLTDPIVAPAPTNLSAPNLAQIWPGPGYFACVICTACGNQTGMRIGSAVGAPTNELRKRYDNRFHLSDVRGRD